MEYYSETQILKILLAAKPDDYLPVSKYINWYQKDCVFMISYFFQSNIVLFKYKS